MMAMAPIQSRKYRQKRRCGGGGICFMLTLFASVFAFSVKGNSFEMMMSDAPQQQQTSRRANDETAEPTPSPTPEPTPSPTPDPTPGGLGNCASGCVSNSDCSLGLYCFRRPAGNDDDVSGCDGLVDLDADNDNSYCVEGPPGMLINYGGTPRTYHYPLGICNGDCDEDSDCDSDLVCWQRDRGEIIPGCIGGQAELSKTDYCVQPNSCHSECNKHSDCSPGFYCYNRNGPIQGLSNEEQSNECPGKDHCALAAPGKLIDYGSSPHDMYLPLSECQGDCDNDGDCDIGLICFQRGPHQSVPTCTGGDQVSSNTDFCVPEPPTNPPYYLPTPPNGSITYHPGNLTTLKDDLLLSEGLDAKLIATSDLTLQYCDGSYSSIPFHSLPDAGATFKDTRDHNNGGWIYVSNSEVREAGKGGVGAITFASEGNVIDYQMVLENSRWNCGGGRTPWGTWVSCEESANGIIWQVDPFGEKTAEIASIGSDGGAWESFAYDIRDPTSPQFFATEDKNRGALERFTPSNPDWNNTWSILHGHGSKDYLVLEPDDSTMGETGTFYWTPNREIAKDNAAQNYPNTEGIDSYEGRLYFVCKKIKKLFILDLDEGTYTRSSSRSGLFDDGPDQLQRILNGEDDGLLYMTEDGGRNAGVHARDSDSNFYTILESPKWPGETTGLAFSPNGMYMYIAYQKVGKLYSVWRRDGLPFHATHLDVKYHDGN